MDTFKVEQITPNSLYYIGKRFDKKNRETKVIEGVVRTIRKRDFDYDELSKFAEDGAFIALNPPVMEKKSDYAGMHNGSLRGKSCDRRNRKSHNARRAQIVSRSGGGK